MPAWLNLSVFGVTLIAMLVGLFGLVVPLFPGILVIWLAALGYGVVTGFSTAGVLIFALITLLMLAGQVADNVTAGVGARQGGASWLALGAALVAGIAGTLLLPPLGGLAGAPLAVLLVEYIRTRDWRKAWVAVHGMAVGWGLSFAIRFIIGLGMIVLWGIWAWLR
jgi:uncharacterized protein YqgC (DUF456 family)